MMLNRKTNRVSMVISKAGVFLLVSLYLLLSIGVLKATHFCMGREASVVFFAAETNKCCCSLYSGENDDCCDEKQELLRIDDEQKVLSSISVPAPVWKLERIFTEQFLAINLAPLVEERSSSDLLLRAHIPIWKSNCSLLFYGDEDLLA